MKSTRKFRGVIAVAAAVSLLAAACGDDEPDATETTEAAAPATDAPVAPETTMAEDMADTTMGAAMASSEACDTDAVVALVQGGESEGTLEGMTDDPVATAASNNPVLTTLVAAVGAADLGDTLNGAEALTVFAPTDCAFAELDPATLQAALDDPSGLLTQVLGFHVIAGQRLSSEDLAGVTELETFTGAMLPIEVDGDTISVGGGQATVLVPDIQTANATVFLIDSVMLPPMDEEMTDTTMADAAMASSEACDTDAVVALVQGGESEGTLEGMTDDPVATAASNNPVLTTLVAAVGAAGLGDTLNGAEALTVFAPTDCAFAELDPATLQAALDDPSGLLTQVLGFHVIAGQRLSSEDLAGVTELETFTGAMLPIEVDGDTISVGGGQATVLVPDIQTANATVFLIDSVMLPPA